jgi:hypothetical protein
MHLFSATALLFKLVCGTVTFADCHIIACAITSVLRILIERSAVIQSVHCIEMATLLCGNGDITYVVSLFRVQVFCPL